ncbi:transcription factor S-II, central domain-containing protein [Spinellus fusiger]|nr:transcription factor S-II, central domain-containing protein [Spinellus fusiger]
MVIQWFSVANVKNEEAEDLDWLCKKCEDANTAKVQKNPVSLPAPVVIALPPQPTTPPPPPPPPPTPPVLITLPASTVHNLQRKPIEKTYSGRNARYSAIQAKCIYPPCLNRTRVDSYCSDICVRLDAVRQATREPKDSDYAPPADDTRAHRRIRHVSGPLTELEKPKPLPSPGHQKMPSISLSISSSGPNSPILDIQSPGLGTEENPIRKNVIKNMTVILKSIMESALENDPTLFDIESDQETIDTKPNSPTEETTEDKSVPVEISEHEVSLPVADSTTTKPEKDTDMSANTDINIDADTEMTVAVTVNHSSLLEVDSATDMETDKDAGITAIATDMKTDNSTKLVTDKTEETATAMTIETTRSNSDDYTTAIKTDINSTPTSTPITTPTTVTDPQDIQKKQRPVQEMAAELAQSIEEVMYLQLGDPHPFPNRPLICGERYKGKFRSLLYNLKDKANEVFQIRVVTGELTPDELIKMSSEAMANPELKSMSETLRKKSIKNSVLKVQSMPFIKKTHKGDIIMIPKGENEYSDESVKAKAFARDMTMAYENNKESSEGNESLGNSLEISKNSAHPSPPLTTANITANTIPLSDSLTHSTLHMTTASATSSPTNTLHANALTTTALPPRHDPLDDILARIGVSTEDMHEDSNKRPSISLTTPHRAKKRKSTFDVEKMLGDEDIQLEIGSDDEGFITTRRTQDGDTVRVQLTEDKEEVPVEESTPKLPGIWKGRVNMPQVAEFEAMARQVGGRPLTPVEWAEVLSPTMWIEGRIPQERVTNYVSQTQYSSSREIILLEIEAATLLPEAAKEARASNTKQSDTLLKYFNSRQRYGVVGHNKTKVKDFYLIPLYKAHDIPDCLYVVRIEESKRDCDLFLGVLILTKQSEQQQQQQRPYSIPPAYQHHPPYEP